MTFGISIRGKKRRIIRKDYHYEFGWRVSRKEKKAIAKMGQCSLEDIIPEN